MRSGRRWPLILATVMLTGTAAVAVPGIRLSILQMVGRALIVEEAVQTSDVVVIAVDAYSAGVLEASDLIRAGIATRVAVFTDPPSAVDREFLRRGVPYDDAATRAVRELGALGITNVELIQRPVAEGTEDMSVLLSNWCDQHGVRSVIVVTAPDHSRRVRRVLSRWMKGHGTRVFVQPAHYTDFDLNRWWQTRTGVRSAIVELQKLVLDVLRHPIS